MKHPVRKFLVGFAAVFLLAPIGFAHGPDGALHQIAKLGTFGLEGGGIIDNLHMSYVTHGTLSQDRDNAILFLHGFAGNHHNADHTIGPGKAFDTDRYFVIASDSFGNTQTGYEHSTSPTTSGLKMNFPAYNGRDMINAEFKLITEGLRIEHLVAVAGISMGGLNTLQLAVSHPDLMDAAIPIVGSAGQMSNMILLTDRLLRSAIEYCAGWQDGDYIENPRECAGAALASVMPQFYSRDWWYENMTSAEAFDVWYRRWWDNYVGVQDTRDLYLQWAAPKEISDTPGFNNDLAAALGAITTKVLFIISPHDQFFSAAVVEDQAALIPDSRIVSINRNIGHMICCGEDSLATDVMSAEIARMLDTELGQ